MKLASKQVLVSDAADWLTMPNEERARGGRRGKKRQQAAPSLILSCLSVAGLQPQEMKIGSSTAWLLWATGHTSTQVSGAFATAGSSFPADSHGQTFTFWMSQPGIYVIIYEKVQTFCANKRLLWYTPTH